MTLLLVSSSSTLLRRMGSTLVMISIALSSLFAQSGEEGDSIVMRDIGVVVVTAQRRVDRKREIIPPQKLSGQQLQSLSAFSIADALRYFSGVQVKDYGGVGGIKTINIRSMGSHHVGVFYDGVELSQAQNGQVDLGQYSLDNMESIQIYNGQKGSYLQPAKDFGSSGSVYMQTRHPRFSDGRRTNMRATMRMGSFDLINPALLWEQRLAQNLSMSLNGEWLKSSGRYKFRYRRMNPTTHEMVYDTTAVRENGDIEAARLEANFFGVLPEGRWMLKGYHYRSERGLPGAIVNNVWRRGERMWDNNSFVQGTYEQQLHDRLRVHGVGKYTYYHTRYVNNDDKLLYVDNLYNQHELYMSLSGALQLLNGWYLSGAYDLQWNKLDGNVMGFVFPVRQTHLAALSSTYTNDWLNLQGSLLGTFARDFARKLSNPPRYHKFTPALLASFKPWKELDLRFSAFYKQSFRLPTFNDLYYADIGNSKLDPEFTTQYDLGLEYKIATRHPWLRLLETKVDAYYNQVHNKIVAYPKGQQFRWTILNLGEVDIRGVDALLSWAVEPLPEMLLTLRAQYTYQRAIDITSPKDSYYRHQIPYIPWHSGSAIVMLQYRGWQLNYNFMYVGERYNQQENILYNYTQPWYTNDLGLSKDFKLWEKRVRLQLECNNIFNQDYDVIINYPMPMRNYRISLVVTL